MPNHPLLKIQMDLQLTVSAMCKHLRHKSFMNEETERGGMIILIESQMMADEVGYLIRHHQSVEKALQQYLLGEDFDGFADCEGHQPMTIYEYCLDYFEGAECPLGFATKMLSDWVSSYVERHQALAQIFEKTFGDPYSITVPDDDGQPRSYVASDAEKFNMNSVTYLRLIEQSHVLENYNERMLRVHTMLLVEEPIDLILKIMQSN